MTTETNDVSVLYSFSKMPCFRSAMMWGIAGGMALGFHRYNTSKRIIEACDASIATWGVISLTSWILCRKNYRDERRHKQDLIKAMNSGDENSHQYFRSEPIPNIPSTTRNTEDK